MKQLEYHELGLGDFILEATVSLPDGASGFRADAVFKSRFLIEHKTTMTAANRRRAKQQLTCYASEMKRAQKPQAELDWIMVVTDLKKHWEMRHFAAGQPQSPWTQTDLAHLPLLAPGPLDTPFTETEHLIWTSANIHHAQDGTLVKTCTTCGKEKMLGAYGLNPQMKDGLVHHCTQCKQTYNRERYRNNTEYRNRHLIQKRERYWNDPVFRERSRAEGRERYAKRVSSKEVIV